MTEANSAKATIDLAEISKDDRRNAPKQPSKIGYYIGAGFGFGGLSLVFLTTPFLFPALRKHCLPYVPATDSQLVNISKALNKHAKHGEFLDIGSGDGRICRLAASLGLFNQVHGVELNSMLVLYSRFMALKSGQFRITKYYHRDLWKFPIQNYDNVCIFGVESMMSPLQKYLIETNMKPQTIFACRFPFENITAIDELGEGIDTVWVYTSLEKETSQTRIDEPKSHLLSENRLKEEKVKII